MCHRLWCTTKRSDWILAVLTLKQSRKTETQVASLKWSERKPQKNKKLFETFFCDFMLLSCISVYIYLSLWNAYCHWLYKIVLVIRILFMSNIFSTRNICTSSCLRVNLLRKMMNKDIQYLSKFLFAIYSTHKMWNMPRIQVKLELKT